MDHTNYKAVIVFAIIFIGFAVLGGHFETKLDRDSVDWPQTTAKIISYQECSSPYECGISYSYTVNREKFIGNRVMFSGYHMPKGWSHTEKKEWIAVEFPINKNVPVFYNVENPRQSALLVGMTVQSFNSTSNFFSKALIIFLCIIGIWLFVTKKT